jgi:hypothetical protein
MDTLDIVFLVFGIIGVLALVYTIYYGRKNLKKKFLVFANSIPIPLAQAFSPETDYKLSVLFQRKGSSEERIESVYTTFLKFANLGRESIRGSDIAPANPIKINIEGARTLDIQIAGITREVNNVYIRNQVIEDARASAEVRFDFLDYRDGALIKILTVGNEGEISLSGDIIGMPEGIKYVGETSVDESRGTEVSGWAFGAILIIWLALSAFIHFWVTGSWDHVWLIIVPLTILIILIGIISTVAWPSGRPSFPKSLDLPNWCRSLLYPRGMMRADLLGTKLEEKARKLDEEIESKQKKIDELKSKK